MEVFFRVDGGPGIGAGHVMRCSSIAEQARDLGARAVFLVSGEESKRLAEDRGFPARCLGGDPGRLDADAGERLREAVGGSPVLVDSYGVTDGFFDALSEGCPNVAYIDDAFTWEGGFVQRPRRWPVQMLVNYSFGYGACEYRDLYGGGCSLLIGPRYAPVRSAFRELAGGHGVSEAVGRILVTSGSTNPDRALEKMVQGCLEAAPSARIDVVVGGIASFDGSLARNGSVVVHRGVEDLSWLMLGADIAVSAAGTTLYELCALGVPSAVLPVVENQMANVRGFARLLPGQVCQRMDWTAGDVSRLVGSLAPRGSRLGASSAMGGAVDGLGARRIAEALLGMQ